jgi:DNA-binding transcriptional regulator of glucitol operon
VTATARRRGQGLVWVSGGNFARFTCRNAIVDDDLGIRQEMHRLNSGDQAGDRVAGMGWCA